MGLISNLVGGLFASGGGNKAARAQVEAAQIAADVQRDALNTSINLSRPQLEVGNSALSVLAGLFGLEQPSTVNFGNLSNTPLSNVAGIGSQSGFNGGTFSLPGGGSFTVPGFQPTINTQRPASGGLSLSELVSNNPLIQFNREQGEQAIARGAAARGLNQSGTTLQDLVGFNQRLSGAGVQDFVLNPLFELAGFGPRASSNLTNAALSTGANISDAAIHAGNARSSAFQNTGNIFGNIAAFAAPGIRSLLPQGSPIRSLI